jgi:16S rRNA (guanine527-N7)-methyltransferase
MKAGFGGGRKPNGRKSNGRQSDGRGPGGGQGPRKGGGQGGAQGGSPQGGRPPGGSQGRPQGGTRGGSQGDRAPGGPRGGGRDGGHQGRGPAGEGPRGRGPKGPQGGGPRGGRGDESQGGGWDSRPQPGWGQKPARDGSWKDDGKPRPFGWKTGPKPAFHKGRPASHGRPSGPPPTKPELGRLMSLYGVKLPQHTLDLLWKYHQFLRANNKDLDLTRLIGFETMAQRHYADCMILHGFMEGRWPSPLVDVGSGAGFPGIMIKLMSPKTRIILAEPRPRRVDFLERTIKELGLKDISVFPHKVTSKSFTEPMAGTITRAFETVEKSLPRFGGCLGVGGKAIFMKGPKVAEELTTLANDEYRVLKNHVYRIPNTPLDRALLVMERIKVPAPGEAAADLAPEDDEIPEGEDMGGDG